MPKAFVTGGSGFIGGSLIRRLIKDGSTVCALARSDESERAVADLGAEPVRGELGDTDSIVPATGVMSRSATMMNGRSSWASAVRADAARTASRVAIARRRRGTARIVGDLCSVGAGGSGLGAGGLLCVP